MIEALNRGMEAGAWAFGALLIFGLGVLLVVLGIAGLGWAFGDGEDAEGMEPRDEEGEPVDDLIRHGCAVPPFHGPAGPISLKTVHRTVFRAFDAPKGKAFGGQADPGVRAGACQPDLAKNSPPDCFPGARSPKGEGFRKRGSSFF